MTISFAKFFILLLSLLLIIACQSSHVTVLNKQQLDQLTDQQIIAYNAQSCQQQDRHAVIAKETHDLQLHLNTLIQSFPQSINGQQLNYRVYLNIQPNAWSSLNGCIRITSGLLKKLNDNEIQAVIAHEIGHIALNHSIQSFHRAKSAEITQNGKITLLLPQSLLQQQELEADDYALNFLKMKHISSDGLITMLDKLNHNLKQENSSHPTILVRKNNLTNKMN